MEAAAIAMIAVAVLVVDSAAAAAAEAVAHMVAGKHNSIDQSINHKVILSNLVYFFVHFWF